MHLWSAPHVVPSSKSQRHNVKKDHYSPVDDLFTPSWANFLWCYLIAYLCSIVFTWTRYFPHIIYFSIFFKSLPCNTNSTGSQGGRVQELPAAHRRLDSGDGEALNSITPPPSWLGPALSFLLHTLGSHGRVTEWINALSPYLLPSYLPRAGTLYCYSSKGNPKDPSLRTTFPDPSSSEDGAMWDWAQ